MKKIVFFLFILTLFLSLMYLSLHKPLPGDVSSELRYSSLKEGYTWGHPGQSLVPYPWDPYSSTRVLPFNFEIPAAPSNSFSVVACRNESESASFVINAQKDISEIGIHVPDLKNSRGLIIPSTAIDLHTVKVWYQAGDNDISYNTPGKVLVPELLLKDDKVVKVDYVNEINYLNVTLNGSPHYIEISNPQGIFPEAATVNDASSLQPFSMSAQENKQIWMTVTIPVNTSAGDYYGEIVITSLYEAPVIMNFSVTVLPFDLEPAPVEYSLYYRGRLSSTPEEGINSEWKTPEQYATELRDMKDHGILYPTLYQGYDQRLDNALALRKASGLPQDRIYLLGIETGNASDSASLTTLAEGVKQWKSITSHYGYSEIYVYGIDEAQGSILSSERPAWKTVKQNGAKLFVAGNPAMVDVVGDLLDTAVVAGPLNTTLAEQWHRYGQKIFSYANPQVGIENPEIYRRNYGFALWNAGYDGEMDYAYQHSFGNIWNDFDDLHYRDHVFAYPTSNGVIDTIQWEGFREGVDDTRYLATLVKKDSSDLSSHVIITRALSKHDEMASVRKKIIDRILIPSAAAPVIPELNLSVRSGTNNPFIFMNLPMSKQYVNLPNEIKYAVNSSTLAASV
jgi:hypothetical protein